MTTSWSFQIEYGLNQPGVSDAVADQIIEYIGDSSTRVVTGEALDTLTVSFPVLREIYTDAAKEAVSRAHLAVRLAGIEFGEVKDMAASKLHDGKYLGTVPGLRDDYYRYSR